MLAGRLRHLKQSRCSKHGLLCTLVSASSPLPPLRDQFNVTYEALSPFVQGDGDSKMVLETARAVEVCRHWIEGHPCALKADLPLVAMLLGGFAHTHGSSHSVHCEGPAPHLRTRVPIPASPNGSCPDSLAAEQTLCTAEVWRSSRLPRQDSDQIMPHVSQQ